MVVMTVLIVMAFFIWPIFDIHNNSKNNIVGYSRLHGYGRRYPVYEGEDDPNWAEKLLFGLPEPIQTILLFTILIGCFVVFLNLL